MGIAAALVITMALPAMADVSQNVGASVEVTGYSSVTITANPITFGSVTPGAIQSAAANNPAVNVEAASENNQDITVQLSGTDFSDGGSNSFAIANAFWCDSAGGTKDAMEKTGVGTDVVATLSAGESVDVYHWLTVPNETPAASYTSTFTYATNATAG